MANVNLYRASIPVGAHSKVSWIECEGYPGPIQYLQEGLRSIDFQARNNSPSASSAATISIIGYCNDDCTGCYLIGETTTTSTTIPPVNFTLTPSCEGTGVNGTGKIIVNGFSGGNGTYTSVAIGNSAGSALSATPIALSGASTYSFTGVFNGTWYVILRDSSGASTTKSTLINCTATTTTTTSTTTAAPICTYAGGSAVIAYTSTTTTSTSTTSTSTTTAASTTSTSTSTTTTAAPCNAWKAETSGNAGDGGGGTYVNCDGVPGQAWGVDNSAAVYFCAIGTPVQTSGTGVNLSNLGLCASTSTTTTTTNAPSATLQWDFEEVGGADGSMVLYVNGSVIETRYITSSGTYTVYEGDTINVEVSCNTCFSPDTCSTAESQSNKSILDASDTVNNGAASIFTSVYTVVSGDMGNSINLSTFAICNSTCL